MKKKLGKYKIAAYIRVSTEEQAENPECLISIVTVRHSDQQ